jgi:hypothetical protein
VTITRLFAMVRPFGLPETRPIPLTTFDKAAFGLAPCNPLYVQLCYHRDGAVRGYTMGDEQGASQYLFETKP